MTMAEVEWLCAEVDELRAEVAALQAENERLRKDAGRYRWLRAMATQQADSLGPIFRIDVRRSAPYLFNFDAAIDAAMQRTGGGDRANS